jgi:hypothetical protein
VQRTGRSGHYARWPLLSIHDVLLREQLHGDNGELSEGQVIVCDLQPDAGLEMALQARRNLNGGVSYHYFVHLTDATIDMLLQTLQFILIGARDASGRAIDFDARIEAIKGERKRVLNELSGICRARNLLVSLRRGANVRSP